MSEPIVKIGQWSVAVSDDEPTAVFPISEWLDRRHAPSHEGGYRRIRLVVEVKQPRGGHNARALLGGELHDAEQIVLRVAQSSPTGLGAQASCHAQLGRDLVPGLPPEFAGPTLGALDQRIADLGSGEIVIDRAAYDEVDSSPFAFERASILLYTLLRCRSLLGDDAAALQGVVSSW